MVKMLVLSDRINLPRGATHALEKDVEGYAWIEYPNIPRLSDYEVVVLDMKTPVVNEYNGAFIGQRGEATTLLNSGGVIICLNYFTTRTGLELDCTAEAEHSGQVMIGHHQRCEINYDWIENTRVLTSTNIANKGAKVGRNFVVLSKDHNYLQYFKGVTDYHKTIENVTPRCDEKEHLLGYDLWLSGQTQLPTSILAIAKVSQRPIACQIDYFDGSLIFLPQSDSELEMVVDQLYEIGKSAYEQNLQRTHRAEPTPEWLVNRKTKQELDLENQITELEIKLEQKKTEHRRFDDIDLLLYGTGTELEDAVQRCLEELSFDVQKTEKGATIDFNAKTDFAKFAIEVTGVNGEILKDNKKFAQILQYLPNKDDDEKIVLLANTYRQIDDNERAGKENFTKPVQRIAVDNRFCLMTTLDLFLIWKDFLNAKSPEKAIAKIFSTEGEYRRE
jgi:hypothetical protein